MELINVIYKINQLQKIKVYPSQKVEKTYRIKQMNLNIKGDTWLNYMLGSLKENILKANKYI